MDDQKELKLFVFCDNFDHSEDTYYHPDMVISDNKEKAIQQFLYENYYRPDYNLSSENVIIVRLKGGYSEGEWEYLIKEYEITPQYISRHYG